MRAADERGQAAVELVGLLPLLAGAVLAVAQLLAAGVAHELAGHAAQAAAMALAGRDDPARAARESLPGWSRDRVSVHVSGRQVLVRLRPAAVFPGASGLLVAVARADAGPRVVLSEAGGGVAGLPDVVRTRDAPGVVAGAAP